MRRDQVQALDHASQCDPLLDLILRFITLGSVLIGAAAIYTAVRNNTRQLGAQIFLSYSSRLHDLRRSLSDEHYHDRLTDDFDGEASETRRFVSDVVQLVFELHALRRHGYVENNIWRVWEADINRLLRTPGVRREWPILQREYATHPKFVVWVLEKQAGLPSDLGTGAEAQE
jgi:hypothetical protein